MNPIKPDAPLAATENTGIISPDQLTHIAHSIQVQYQRKYYTDCLNIIEACNGNGTEARHRIQDAINSLH